MRWPIRYQILVPFAAIMLAAVLFVSLLNAFLAARRTERQIVAQLRDVARTLLDSSFPLTDAVLGHMRGLSGAEFVLSDERGQTRAASRTFAERLPEPPEPVARWEALELGPPVDVGGQRYFAAALRINARGPRPEPLVLQILYPERDWRQSRREAAYPSLAAGGTALVLAVLSAVAIAGRLSRPIQRLRAQVERLAEGDFRTLPLPERNDELGDLARGVNSLAEQLDDMRRAIGRAERLALLGQLSGGLAHHLRNDVTGARMAVELHQRSCRAPDQESLEVALRQLVLTEEHLQRFLASGQPQQPQRVACDLEQIARRVVRLVEPSCRHRKVELRFSTGEPLEPFDADPDQVRHVLMNLVLNAVEAAGPGGWVRMELDADGDGVRLRVLDSGAGPPDDFVERLFEPFSTTKPEGVGLGLSVARQVAEAHGGSLRYGRRGGATCFELALPPGPAAERPAPASCSAGGARE